MSGADSVQVRAVRAARALAAAHGLERVCAALEAAAAHLDDGTAAGAAGAYVVAREARLALGAAAPGPLADALDVALAVINAARLGDAVPLAPNPGPLPPNPGPLPAGYAAPAAYVRVEPPADEAGAIVRALAAADPNFRGHDPDHECIFCGVLGATNPAGHAGRCPWRAARAWVAAHDADPDPEPPLYDDGPGPEPWQQPR